MHKRTHITTFGVILLSSATLFTASTRPANAWVFDPFENMVETTLQAMGNIILGLSSDTGIMADRIGDMADRIVYTEGTIVTRTSPISISLSSQKTDYLLYISNNADMSGATNALVQNSDTSIAWGRVADFATGNKLYIAVKTVGRTTSSDFSNTVMLNLQ